MKIDCNRRTVLCTFVWLLTGCEGNGPTVPPAERVLEIGPVAATDRKSYSWRNDSAFVWILANPHSVDVFYYPGNHVYLERWDAGQWQAIGLYGSIAADPVRLVSGDTLAASVQLSNDVFPKSGWYRVHSKLFRDTALTTLWPLGNRVSPAVWVGP